MLQCKIQIEMTNSCILAQNSPHCYYYYIGPCLTNESEQLLIVVSSGNTG